MSKLWLTNFAVVDFNDKLLIYNITLFYNQLSQLFLEDLCSSQDLVVGLVSLTPGLSSAAHENKESRA